MNQAWIATLGTTASVIVAVSLLMRNIKRLRLVNLVGASAFAAYGYLIDSQPVLWLNTFIAMTNLYYLKALAKRKEFFRLLRVDVGASPYVELFLSHYGDDIHKFIPEFAPQDNDEGWLVLRDMVPVSLVVFHREEGGILRVVLDYAVPAYRDYKNGEFFYSAVAEKYCAEGMQLFQVEASVPCHISYLKRVGFRECSRAGDKTLLEKPL